MLLTPCLGFNVAQHTLYDYRGADGTGTASNKVTPTSANAKSYTVRKLADGNCWMTENLALPLSTTQGIEVVDNNGNLAPARTDTTMGDINNSGIWMPAGTGGNNAIEPLNSNTKTPASNGNYYYSWYAATAGSDTSSLVNTEASLSICPRGWKIPANYTIDSTKSYGSLTNAYNLTSGGANNTQNHVSELESSPLNFARSGYYYSGGLEWGSTIGYYWSSTTYSSDTYAYYFYYNTDDTYPQYRGFKYNGLIIRCVAL